MEAAYQWLNTLLTNNKNDFSQFPDIKWVNPYMAEAYQQQRAALLQELDRQPLFKDTKPYHGHISKGCRICGAGKWSCLFITNQCNANCFYCPAPQQNDELPSTQGLDFSNPGDYAAYINHFRFEGVSFSGGEPLLYFERTLQYLKTLRQQCDPDLYIWMYTNGMLADAAKLQALAAEHLNEIRFDIGATGFGLDKVRLAKGIIPVVTIEIPSVPEEKDRIIALLPRMLEAGVTNLNLHHLRLTKHNAAKLVKRGYHILSAERPLVIESEMAALEIIQAAQKAGLDIGINYCSFHFKNRFQKAGYRRMLAQTIVPGACITENGYIREYDGHAITYKRISLSKIAAGASDDGKLEIGGIPYSYTITRLFAEDKLSLSNKKMIDALLEHQPQGPPADPLLFQIWQYEYIESGLRDF